MTIPPQASVCGADTRLAACVSEREGGSIKICAGRLAGAVFLFRATMGGVPILKGVDA